jgi:squalene-hopene/tetraprenyl-beta-curcumene cyclase
MNFAYQENGVSLKSNTPSDANFEFFDTALERKVDSTIDGAASWLLNRQADDGHWIFELEADATIPAEYIFLNHFLGEIDDEIEQKIAVYLRRQQNADGGWPLFFDGDTDLSASIKAYYALKLVGDDPNEPHMVRARDAILLRGGASKANVFTRFALALFGQLPWRAVPVIRVEVMLLPRWSPFHIDKVSYWSRTVVVPLLVIAALKPKARNPRGIGIEELFIRPPADERQFQTNPTGHWLGEVFLKLDTFGHRVQNLIPSAITQNAVDKAMQFITDRLNGEDGLGGIFPAMANAVMAFDALGYERDHPDFVTARRAIDKLLVIKDEEAYCQPCLSPVWDTSLVLHALQETGYNSTDVCLQSAASWLETLQIVEQKGDWLFNRPQVPSGGWAFQYRNDFYPDVDDTAVVVMGLDRLDDAQHSNAIRRASEWIVGMQSTNGGWGAFDADNEYYVLEHIPFADHGALLDPPTEDVTARCVGMLAQLGYKNDDPTVASALAFLRERQEPDGSWFGRWGTNYVYGTWSVLSALNAVGEDLESPYIRKAVTWLKSCQREDGGWGEDCATYWPDRRGEAKTSLPTQTAWALLGLMAAGEIDSEAVRRGVEYLVDQAGEDGIWDETYYNAVGFPRVFYLRYHGYSAYFPLWALARYRNLSRGNHRTTEFGI